MTNASFHRLDIPSGKDVCRKQFFHFMDKLIEADISHGDYETYMSDVQQKFANISKEEILKRVAALEFNHFLKYYEHADDLNARQDFRDRRNDGSNNRNMNGGRERAKNNYQRDNGFTRLFINLGTRDGFYKASFLQFILDESNLKKEVLGKIDLRESNSWVEIDRSVAPKMIRSLDGKNYNGRQLRMNDADGGSAASGSREKRKRIPVTASR